MNAPGLALALHYWLQCGENVPKDEVSLISFPRLLCVYSVHVIMTVSILVDHDRILSKCLLTIESNCS